MVTKIRGPRPASICTVYIKKVVSTPNGDIEPGYGTGFLYKDESAQLWLVTNWHVLTARRPDDPGHLLKGYPQSPYLIRVTFAHQQRGAFTVPFDTPLYDKDGRPIWREYKRDAGVDLAAIPIIPPSEALVVAVNDFAEQDQRALEPGLDVIVVGFPFEHSVQFPFPVWKRAMLATEPGYLVMGVPQLLLDTPGRPGMSGAPVFRSGRGFSITREQRDALRAFEKGETSALDIIAGFNVEQMMDETVVLTFVGVYAGSTDDPLLERLSLGRMFIGSFVDILVKEGTAGENPFSPVSI